MKQELHEEKRLVGKGEIAAYSLAGGGQNFCYALVTGYLMYYYINVFGIHPQIVSIMLLLEGIWDIVNNPLAGFLIDRTRTKWGKMVPISARFLCLWQHVRCCCFPGRYCSARPLRRRRQK